MNRDEAGPTGRYLDPRAAGLDAEVERAVRSGDLDPLLGLDQALARELMATGRPVWQVLAGALRGLAPSAEVLYCDDPFGVSYLVACLRPGARPDDGPGSGPDDGDTRSWPVRG